MEYRAEATSLEGFVQQLAVGYLCRGYRFYFQGLIPAGKDPRAVDAKLIARYGLAVSKFERARRKARGLVNVQYLRYRRHFVLLSTSGEHDPLRDDHKLKDAHEVPIKLGGYAASFRGGHAQVRIERDAWKQLKAYYLDLGTERGDLTPPERVILTPWLLKMAVLGRNGNAPLTPISGPSSISSTRGSGSSRHSSRKCGSGGRVGPAVLQSSARPGRSGPSR
jgi:hypothetical protein